MSAGVKCVGPYDGVEDTKCNSRWGLHYRTEADTEVVFHADLYTVRCEGRECAGADGPRDPQLDGGGGGGGGEGGYSIVAAPKSRLPMPGGY